MSELQKIVDDLLRSMYHHEWNRFAKQEFGGRPRWKGFTGISSILDEVKPITFHSYTPTQFEKMWDHLSREQRVSFVKSRLEKGK